MKKINYKHIFDLIDKSNTSNHQAEIQLIQMGIYNNDGDLITKNPIILKYYEDNWC